MGAKAYTRPGEDERANTRRATPARDTPHTGCTTGGSSGGGWQPSVPSPGSKLATLSRLLLFSKVPLCFPAPSCAIIFSVHWKPQEALPGIAKPQKWPLVLKTAVTPASNTPQDKWVSQIFLSHGDSSLVPCTSARLTQWSGRFSPGAPFLATPWG